MEEHRKKMMERYRQLEKSTPNNQTTEENQNKIETKVEENEEMVDEQVESEENEETYVNPLGKSMEEIEIEKREEEGKIIQTKKKNNLKLKLKIIGKSAF
jgi:hypothetical protein